MSKKKDKDLFSKAGIDVWKGELADANEQFAIDFREVLKTAHSAHSIDKIVHRQLYYNAMIMGQYLALIHRLDELEEEEEKKKKLKENK